MSKAEEKFIEELDKEHEIILGFQEYEKKIAEFKQQLALTEKAFDLMSLVLCTGARDDLKSKINKFAWREDVKKFFLEQAKKEIENE